jgi:hypothetical protein
MKCRWNLDLPALREELDVSLAPSSGPASGRRSSSEFNHRGLATMIESRRG